jgi:hypothetical protein
MLKYTIIAIALVLLAYVGFGFAKNNRYAVRFEQIAKGTSAEAVRNTMGRPSAERNACRDSPTWLGARSDSSSCSLEYQYDAFLLPKFWTIGFDAAGKAVAKYEYVSP